MTFVWTLGELMLVQPLRLGLDALARMQGRLRSAESRLHVSPMSSDWLRQHESDSGKHDLAL